MYRALLCFAVLTNLAVPCRAEGTITTAETLIELNVSPAPAPKPALRYLLLPDLREMSPGNPIQSYMKCMMEDQNFFFARQGFVRRERLLAVPLRELPAQEVYNFGQSTLSQADRAARLDKPDWQLLLKLKSDGSGTLSPELQQVRALGRALKVRFQAEVALRHFDDAIRTAKTMFAMSRHLSEHPTLIGGLIGIAVASQAVEVLDEMLEQPGCPNLYWALTSLPRPLVPLDKCFEGERVAIFSLFRNLDDSAPFSAVQLKTFIESLDNPLINDLTNNRSLRAWLDAQVKDQGKLDSARRRLIESGLPEERLLRFPADQLILLDEKRELEIRFDDFVKTLSFPVWQGEALTAASTLKEEPAFFADAFMSAILPVRKTQGRLDQRIALLRQVEALRIYAALHKGSLAAKLADITVPLPDDPFTGRPFRYEFTGSVAHVRGSPPQAEEKKARFNVHYEVTVRKVNQ